MHAQDINSLQYLTYLFYIILSHAEFLYRKCMKRSIHKLACSRMLYEVSTLKGVV